MEAEANLTVPAFGVAGLRLADMIPRDAERVIEICRSGESVAARTRLWNPAVRFLTVTWRGDTPLDLASILRRQQQTGFDAVVLHDVAGDSADPFTFFSAAAPFLKPGAAMLAAIPNLRYWRNLGKTPRGFTLGDIKGALDRHRLRADQATPVHQPEDETPESLQRIEELATRHKLVPSKLGASHFIVRAVAPAGGFRRLLVQAITLTPIGACNIARIDQPLDYLSTIPGVRTTSSVGHLARPEVAPAGDHNIAIVQRRVVTHADIPNNARMAQLGYLTISEFDDLPTRWASIAENDNLTFRSVHAVQTSTEPLAKYLATFNPEVGIFPNQIAAAPPYRATRGEGVTIFFGAFNREGDWKELIGSINAVIASSPVPLSFHVVHDRAFFDALATDRKSFTPTCNYARYTAVLRQCDIALLPLRDTLFNQAKSDLKFIECAIHEVAALASPVVYKETIRDGETGFLFTTPQEFHDRLALLVGDAAVREAVIARAHEYVMSERLLAHSFRRRYNWFVALLDRKPELDEQLRRRVPKLFEQY